MLRSQSIKPTAIDLFSGCGGLTLGLKQSGFNVLAAIEVDESAADAYSANHSEVMLFEADIRDIEPRSMRIELGLLRGELDLLAGCPPCQGFSTLRTRNGAKQNRDARNHLIFQMLRFAQAFLPKAIMMENVPRLAEHSSFIGLCEGLKELGYNITYDIRDAGNYGVPQRRKRLILVGGRGFQVGLANGSTRRPTVREAIGSLPPPNRSFDLLHNLPERRRLPRIERLIRDIPKNGGSRSDLPKSRQLRCHRKSDGFHDIYGRMAWDTVAPTITGGCFNPSKGRFLHPQQDRAITMREAALLQGFPRTYVFPIEYGKEAIALMIGNALPPEFIRRHASRIKTALLGEARVRGWRRRCK